MSPDSPEAASEVPPLTSVVAEIGDAILSEQWAKAQELLDAAIEQLGPQAILTELADELEVARSGAPESDSGEHPELSPEEHFEALLSEVQTLRFSGRLDAAAELLEKAGRIRPGDPRLRILGQAMTENRRREARARRRTGQVQVMVDEIEQWISTGNLEAARQLLETSVRELGGDPRFETLAARLEAYPSTDS